MEESTVVSDSPELLAIRARVAVGVTDIECRDDRAALLRMVDELTADRDAEEADADARYEECVALTKERDDARAKLAEWKGHAEKSLERERGLEAKLAEAESEFAKERAHVELILACVEGPDGWKHRVSELEAKLAEAESSRDKAEASNRRLAPANERLYLDADQYRKRAEAAEARVRKLTDALFAATGGHVDLDRLVP